MHFAWVNSLIILVDFSHQKWHPTRHSVNLFFLCIHMSAYIMHYEINILNFAWANSLIILVDFSHRKWHPTRPNVYLFLYASIWVHTLCIMHYAINILHFAWVNSVILVDFRLSTITPHKAQCLIVVFLCIHMSTYIMHYAICNMHYAINILQYAWVNSFIILVDVSRGTLWPK